eukprot:scaffold37308_cov49-Attheya_sp.AAC.1
MQEQEVLRYAAASPSRYPVRYHFAPSTTNMSTNKNKPRLRITWDQSYAELQTYFNTHGNSYVPARYGRLGMWVVRQRNTDRHKLESWQMDKLNALNFDWETKLEKDERAWDQMFGLLQQFLEEHGHSRVPCNYASQGLQLGQWVTSQHKYHRKGKIRDDRRRRLKSVGFLWARDERMVWNDTKERSPGVVDGTWKKMYNHLIEFHREHKHCMVSARMLVKMDDGSSKNLGTWIIRQRTALRDSILKEERKQLLDDLGFVWKIDHYDVDRSLRARQWEEMYKKLQGFKEIHGHCQVPANSKDELTLGQWVRNQRVFEKTGRLDETRFEQLDVVGFDWDPCGSHWNEMYAKLRAYHEKHGHCQIAITYPDDPVLGNWVRNLRVLQAKGKLKDDRVERLNDLEFVWDSNQMRWNTMVDHLKEFTRVHGRVRVPDKYVTTDGVQLGWWVRTQRSYRNINCKNNMPLLTPERIAELDAAGFIWDSLSEEKWNMMFNRLGQFKHQYGHCNVPKSFKGDGDDGRQLGSWVYQQRQNRDTVDTLSLKRKEKLDSIGFLWDTKNDDSNKKPRLQY